MAVIAKAHGRPRRVTELTASHGGAREVTASVWNRFHYSSPFWSEIMYESVRRRPDGCGLGRELLDRAADITAARERSECSYPPT